VVVSATLQAGPDVFEHKRVKIQVTLGFLKKKKQYKILFIELTIFNKFN